MTKRHRSAVTGEYVTAEQAKVDPERTVSERPRVLVQVDATALYAQVERYMVRVAHLEKQVRALTAQLEQQTAGPSTEVAGGCQEQDQAEDRD